MLRIIYYDIPFDVLLLELWEPGYNPDQYGSRNVLTGFDYMTGFGLGAYIGLK